MFLDNFIDKLINAPKSLVDKLKPSDEMAARVERYSDLEGTSTKKLNLGLWYAKHTKIFFLIVVWALAIVASVLWSFSLYLLADYLFVGLKEERANLNSLSQPIDIVRYNYDANLEILDAQALALGNNRYDLVGALKNTNTNVWGVFNYYFLVDGQRQGAGTGFILPNEQKFIISLNQTITTVPSKAVLVLDYFNWRRINAHDIPSWDKYRQDRIDFMVRDKQFLGGNESGLTGNLDINQLTFNVTNQTYFNYKQAPFLIILYSGRNLVAVNRYVFADFKSRQQQAVNLTIIGKLPNITDITVIPDINILDNNNFGPSD